MPSGWTDLKHCAVQCQVIRKHQIVISGEGNELTTRLAQRDVAVGVAVARRLRQIEPANARVSETMDDCRRLRPRSVANNEEFKVGFGLIKDRLDSKADDVADNASALTP